MQNATQAFIHICAYMAGMHSRYDNKNKVCTSTKICKYNVLVCYHSSAIDDREFVIK